MRFSILTAVIVAAICLLTTQAWAKPSIAVKHYAWNRMSLTQRIDAQRQLIIDDWRVITTWREKRWRAVERGNGFTVAVANPKALSRPEPYVIRWRRRHMAWTKRELQKSLKALHARSVPIGSFGGTPGVDSCLDKLIRREGGYNPYAVNPSSGAYGAPQALPGSKMASAGPDWRTNLATQIRWMIGYVNTNYGGSCNALDHSYAYNWY